MSKEVEESYEKRRKVGGKGKVTKIVTFCRRCDKNCHWAGDPGPTVAVLSKAASGATRPSVAGMVFIAITCALTMGRLCRPVRGGGCDEGESVWYGFLRLRNRYGARVTEHPGYAIRCSLRSRRQQWQDGSPPLTATRQRALNHRRRLVANHSVLPSNHWPMHRW